MISRLVAPTAALALALAVISGPSPAVAAPAPFVTAAPAADDTPSPPSRSTLLKAARQVVATGVPGVIVATRDEHGARTLVAGKRSRHGNRPPRAGGQVRIASVTKTFTATLVLDLVADGRLGLDTPVRRYLPGLLPYPERITVRHLLQHRSGLFDYGNVLWKTPRRAYKSRYQDLSRKHLLRIATRRPLQSRPGGRFLYSNTDYVVLGLLVEKVTGRSFAHALSRRVLRPAGLSHTFVPGHDPRLPRAAMRGYDVVHASGRLTDLTAYNMSVAAHSGDLASTVHDMNRFYAQLLGGHLLPPRLLRQMKSGRPAFPGFEYGLGLGQTEMCGQQVWGHVGSVPGYGTHSFTSTDGGRQITVSVSRGLTLDTDSANAINQLVATEFCGDS